MAFEETHELHKRRLGRNVGVGAVLAAFVLIVFGLTVVKISEGNSMEAFDHSVRTSILPEESQ